MLNEKCLNYFKLKLTSLKLIIVFRIIMFLRCFSLIVCTYKSSGKTLSLPETPYYGSMTVRHYAAFLSNCNFFYIAYLVCLCSFNVCYSRFVRQARIECAFLAIKMLVVFTKVKLLNLLYFQLRGDVLRVERSPCS